MIEETPNYLSIWMLLAVSLGFMIGWACGDEYPAASMQKRVDELSEELDELKEQIQTDARTLFLQLCQKGLRNTRLNCPKSMRNIATSPVPKPTASKNNS